MWAVFRGEEWIIVSWQNLATALQFLADYPHRVSVSHGSGRSKIQKSSRSIRLEFAPGSFRTDLVEAVDSQVSTARVELTEHHPVGMKILVSGRSILNREASARWEVRRRDLAN